MEKNRTIAVFDFDGTLTSRDSFLEFVKFAFGERRFWVGLLGHSPLLLLMKMGLYPNWKMKQRIFSWFFKGMRYEDFARLGGEFAVHISQFANLTSLSLLCKHVQESNDVYVITASIEEWVRPYCSLLNVTDVIGTKAEVKDGVLTGCFSSPNCYGKEKVRRLLIKEPDRQSYYLYAYGDSHGDREIINFADSGTYINGYKG